MNTLTKEQIKGLSPEQQSHIAEIALLKLNKQERLFKQLRKSFIAPLIIQTLFLFLAIIELVVMKAPIWAITPFTLLVSAIAIQVNIIDH